jgi:hypothetical protein
MSRPRFELDTCRIQIGSFYLSRLVRKFPERDIMRALLMAGADVARGAASDENSSFAACKCLNRRHVTDVDSCRPTPPCRSLLRSADTESHLTKRSQ